MRQRPVSDSVSAASKRVLFFCTELSSSGVRQSSIVPSIFFLARMLALNHIFATRDSFNNANDYEPSISRLVTLVKTSNTLPHLKMPIVQSLNPWHVRCSHNGLIGKADVQRCTFLGSKRVFQGLFGRVLFRTMRKRADNSQICVRSPRLSSTSFFRRPCLPSIRSGVRPSSRAPSLSPRAIEGLSFAGIPVNNHFCP